MERMAFRRRRSGMEIDMKNELFHIGPFTVYGYGLMIAIGVLAAYLTAEYRAKKMGLDDEKIFGLTIWCGLGGALGAKLLYYITTIQDIIANPKLLLNIADGFVVYGGIIAGVLAGYLYCRRHKLVFLKYFDLVMPSIALAQGFGRIGCFLAGCCYGVETDSWFSVTFHNSTYAPNGVPLVPTQLISSAADFLLFFVLIILAKRVKKDGVIAGLYLIFYSIGRYIIEMFRGDLIRGSVGEFSTSQFISIFILLAGIVLIVMGFRRKEKPAAEVQEEKKETQE